MTVSAKRLPIARYAWFASSRSAGIRGLAATRSLLIASGVEWFSKREQKSYETEDRSFDACGLYRGLRLGAVHRRDGTRNRPAASVSPFLLGPCLRHRSRFTARAPLPPQGLLVCPAEHPHLRSSRFRSRTGASNSPASAFKLTLHEAHALTLPNQRVIFRGCPARSGHRLPHC